MEPFVISSIQTVMKYYPKEQHWIHQPIENSFIAAAYQFSGTYEHIYSKKTYSAEKDDVILYSSNDAYEVFEHAHGCCIAAHFCTAAPADLHFTILDGNTIPQIKADFLRLYKAYNRRDEYSWYDCNAALYTILGKIRRAIDSGDDYIQHQKYANVIRARDYLAENYNDPALSLDEAAAISGVSPRRFGELFRRLYHVTPGQYITRLRISAAEDMLRMRSYTVAEIAEAVGYTSPSYFCRVFTRETGFAPSRFAEREM